MNLIAVDVEITIVRSLKGLPLSLFHPNNPFAKKDYCRPLPYWEYENKFNNKQFNGEFNLIIEEELTITPELDIKKALNCFNQVPSAGAKYTIKLCIDVPDNKHPLLLPPDSGSETGHTFVVMTKANDAKTITQVFGFYAYKHPGYLFPFRPLKSVIKNNQLREINASIEMSLSEAQFENLRKKALELAKLKYAALDYNCSNFGLDLFNSVRNQPITVDSYVVYINRVIDIDPMTIDKTPQMLFKKLKQMKDSNNAEAPHITIDQSTNTKAPLSHGECN